MEQENVITEKIRRLDKNIDEYEKLATVSDPGAARLSREIEAGIREIEEALADFHPVCLEDQELPFSFEMLKIRFKAIQYNRYRPRFFLELLFEKIGQLREKTGEYNRLGSDDPGKGDLRAEISALMAEVQEGAGDDIGILPREVALNALDIINLRLKIGE